MANAFGHFLPPACLNFAANPNIILPPYISSEVHTVVAPDGRLVTLRHPRPLSVISGTEFILQCDHPSIMRYVFNYKIISN
jgi:hypothetical protein